MPSPAAEPPQDAGDLDRLIVRLEALAASDPAKAPACRELLAKLVARPEATAAGRSTSPASPSAPAPA